jgi:hypothetical protein
LQMRPGMASFSFVFPLDNKNKSSPNVRADPAPALCVLAREKARVRRTFSARCARGEVARRRAEMVFFPLDGCSLVKPDPRGTSYVPPVSEPPAAQQPIPAGSVGSWCWGAGSARSVGRGRPRGQAKLAFFWLRLDGSKRNSIRFSQSSSRSAPRGCGHGGELTDPRKLRRDALHGLFSGVHAVP